ncbi:zinc ABC transporter substrate-binding protein ZnuA [Spirabiliibacterium falconis]|uniref:zinc ABC transporter substrate-binding protein ZnuA n=1 Tax=Spirabiliibacterium falconis TaxID=572023 RepID=UPI001AAD45E2|nr:zinc ABC transporter substrate-binding protein ZnuA [Spirabiliibacterium falconis]MBE2895149.1 zinc ABC transporter substrate-binding protein ZnuA [Spirabiliibacterium falconis]
MKKLNKQLLAATVLSTAALSAQADILTTVKPIGFIAAAIAEGVTPTEVLLPAGASPHDYSMRPSDLERLKKAQLVIWVGDEMETFLESSVEKLDEKNVLEIEDIDGIKSLLGKAMHVHFHGDHDHDHKHEHSHDHKHADHDHKHHDHHDHDHHHDGLQTDWHVWYSPKISELVAENIAERLTALYPNKAALINSNLADFKKNIADKLASLSKQLAPVKGEGYYVFHDAYGYFERQFGLNHLGAFTINPAVAPGAKTLSEIKASITEHKAKCLFTEPQFTPRVVETLQKNTGVSVGQLDPLGEDIALGKTAYIDFLQATADSLSHCLSKK